MVRSLYCGISGLRNHQVGMDVTGNNIANVNTVGFKAGRVTYREAMAQLLRGSSRPPGNAGGTNPLQIGLGMSIGSIDTILNQGNMQSTGQITDLALEGRAFFAFSSGEGTFYSRNGALQMDATGRLVSPTNGFSLQGMMAAPDGSFPAGTRIGAIRVPFGEKAPANATTTVKYGCNLDSDSEGLGTVLHTNRFLAYGEATDTITSIIDQSGNSLGIQPGDNISVSAYDGANPPNLITVPTRSITDLTTLADIVGDINTVLAGISLNDTAVYNPLTGQIDISTAGGAVINNLQVRSNRPGSDSYVANLFSFGPSIPVIAGVAASSNTILAPATSTDDLANVFDASGRTLGLEAGDVLSINGAVGGTTAPTGTMAPYVAGMTMNDVLLAIQSTFSLPPTDGTIYNNPSVSMNSADTPDDRIPDGSIAIRGQRETAFALTNLSLSANNFDNGPVAPTRLNANSSLTEIQTARDTGSHSTSIVVYDESGDAHTMSTTFTHTGIPGEWLWDISMDGGEQITGGSRGRITFGQDGSPSSFTFDDNTTGFTFDPMNGSNAVSVQLNVGSPGSFQGITQFRSTSTTAAREQDGYPMGKLSEISIDEYGMIKGMYTNGINKSIAQIYVADFNNPAGLFKQGDSMYATSNNSGEAVMMVPGVGSSTKIKPGALEMSNVELATEFTNMITTQRGYQANARVITTSDQMLQELVQLVR